MAFFIIGALCHRYYEKYRHRLCKTDVRFGLAVVLGVWAFTVSFAHIPVSKSLLMVVYFTIVAMALPLLFEMTRKSHFDRHIGELSYPIYLCHMLVISLLKPIWVGPLNITFGLCACAITIALSLLIYYVVDKPFGLIRERRKHLALSRRNVESNPIILHAPNSHLPESMHK